MTSVPQPRELVGIPLVSRIILGHCVIQAIADIGAIDLLHIKGYSVDDGLYPPGRTSTDVDVLVHPHQVDEFIHLLNRHGWSMKTSFESGSIFHHAGTFWHEYWGFCDVHRFFPGITIAADIAFNRLWGERSSRIIGGHACPVPSRQHQALLIALHGARDPRRGASDIAHLRTLFGPTSWRTLSNVAAEFGAQVPWAASAGSPGEWSMHRDFALWKSLASGSTRSQLFISRWKAEPRLRGRMQLLRTGLSINQDHLKMRLNRVPNFSDYLTEVQAKASSVAEVTSSWFKDKRRRR